MPESQPWADPNYQQLKPVDPRKQLTAVTPLPLKELPKGWILPEQRPKLRQAIAKLQGPPAGGAEQQQDPEELMDESASQATAPEAGLSETPSEMQERQVVKRILFSSPDTIQGTEGEDEDDDEYDDEEESDEDDDEESEELQVAEAESEKLSMGKPKGKGVDG